MSNAANLALAMRPECNLRGIVLDRCTAFYLDGKCRRCGKKRKK